MKRHSPFPESQPKRPRTPQSPRNDSVYPAPSPSLLHIETRGAAPGFEGFGDLVDAEITGFEDDDDEDEQRALDCSIGQPEAIDTPDQEVCFGMLNEATVMGASTKTRLKELKRINSQRPSTTKGNSNLCPVSSIFLGGSSFRIRSQSEQESGIYIGLLDKQSSCGLKKLLSNYKVRLQFYIPLQGASDPARGGVPVYINVYGPASLFDCVGKLLTDCELFLQRPIQIDTDVSYENPQCLRLGHSRSGHGATNTRAFVDFENEVSALFESITPSLLAQNRFAQTGYGIRTKLKKHQEQGLHFMQQRESDKPFGGHRLFSTWVQRNIGTRYKDTVTDITSEEPQKVYGGILADHMGLGKSLTALALITSTLEIGQQFASSMTSSERFPVKTTLLITPTSTLTSWVEQINRHLEPNALRKHIYHGSRRGINYDTLQKYDLLITTYGTIRSEMASSDSESILKRMFFFRIILDEAHIIRDHTTHQFKAISMLQAQRRWCLTGTPIQNKLQDFGSLLKFLGVGPAENDRWFHQKVVKPIQDKDPKGMERLRILVCAYCLRRTKTILEDPLPGNVSLIRDVILNEDERRIYDACKKDTVRSIDKAVSAGVKGSGVGKIQLLQILGQVCNHGMDLLSPERRAQIYDYLPSSFQYPFNMQAQEQFQRESYVNAINIPEIQVHDPMEIDVHDQTVHYRGPSSKVKALIQNIRNDQQDINGSVKSVVFSQWTKMLDLIGLALEAENIRFTRFDGKSRVEQRKHAVDSFRADPTLNVLLVTVGSGSVGLDFTAASRAHLMEPNWNPMVESQSLDRIHRMGQTRDVVTTRYIVKDSIEEYVQECQRRKLKLVDLSFKQDPRDSWEETRKAVLRT